jgi:hypothetical protein
MCGWLGGLGLKDKPAEAGKLLTIEEVGEILNGESESSNPDTRDHGKMNNPTSFLSKTTDFNSKTETLIFYPLRVLTRSQFR